MKSPQKRGYPAKLSPELIEELISEVRRGGPIDLGDGVQIDLRAIDKTCTCACSAVAEIVTGNDTLQQGGRANWSAKVDLAKRSSCVECDDDKVQWAIGGDQTGGKVSIAGDNDKLQVTIRAQANAPVDKTFTLTVTPQATCKCVAKNGTKNTVNCSGTASSVTIKIVK